MGRWSKPGVTWVLTVMIVGLMVASVATPTVTAVQPNVSATGHKSTAPLAWWNEAGAWAAAGVATGAVAGAYAGAGGLSWSLPGTVAGAGAGALAGGAAGTVTGFVGYAAYTGWHAVFGSSSSANFARDIPTSVFDH